MLGFIVFNIQICFNLVPKLQLKVIIFAVIVYIYSLFALNRFQKFRKTTPRRLTEP